MKIRNKNFKVGKLGFILMILWFAFIAIFNAAWITGTVWLIVTVLKHFNIL